MATRQQALEEQMAMLSLSVQKTTKGNSKKNNKEQGNSGARKRNSDSQHDATTEKQKVFSKMLSQTNLNWSASQNAGNTLIIPTTKSFAKGGGQTKKPMGNNNKIGSSAPFIKRLTRAEVAERRAKGLCYNCDESYSMRHRCKKLFWIEVSDIEDEQDDAVDDLEISLHTIRETCN
ncbi:hypothetical protein GOBAR_AA03843 [Gossypium barbadense]|uniref:Uncharacterized protein n=1 Tax=Gossypium barbadense TaxID=3634 RepID=A0A2P5YMA5_GOSBA|nr:hypothetical protein GOBAR_AA03843 [Gossypium barbadense]